MQILKDDKKVCILENAAKLFYEKGYEKTTMREIAKSSKISVGNIYRYFPNKQMMLHEIMTPLKMALESSLGIFKADLFNDTQLNGRAMFIDNLINVGVENYFITTVLFSNLNHEDFRIYREILVESIKEKVMECASVFKNFRVDQVVSEAIGVALAHGLANIVSTRAKKEMQIEQMRVFLDITLSYLSERIKEA